MRLGRSERREIAEIMAIARTITDDEPGSALAAIVPRLQHLLRVEFGVAYRPAPNESGSWSVDFIHAHGEGGPAPFIDLFERHLRETRDRFGMYDPIHPEPEQRNVVGEPFRHMTERQMLETPMLQRVFTPYGLERHEHLRALLCDGPVLLAWFGGIRRESFGDRERAILAELIEPVRARLKLERRLLRAELGDKALVAALDALPSAAFFLTRDGQIVHANAVARTLADHDDALGERVRAFARGHREPGATCTSVLVAGLPEHLLVTMAVPEHDLAERLARARAAWQLTPRQLDVLALVVRGDANKAIADRLRCVENTVEAHVSSILRKAKVENRAALVARFWTTVT